VETRQRSEKKNSAGLERTLKKEKIQNLQREVGLELAIVKHLEGLKSENELFKRGSHIGGTASATKLEEESRVKKNKTEEKKIREKKN